MEKQQDTAEHIEEAVGGTKPQSIVENLAQAFNRIIAPAWLEFIFLESGLVSFLLGLELYYKDPLILVIGGLVQIMISSIFIVRRVSGAKRWAGLVKKKNKKEGA